MLREPVRFPIQSSTAAQPKLLNANNVLAAISQVRGSARVLLAK
ncbi:MAG TPA: hypothetical protein VJT33_02950 [bacterium]|nr:hypothetical protein [bacterium]